MMMFQSFTSHISVSSVSTE